VLAPVIEGREFSKDFNKFMNDTIIAKEVGYGDVEIVREAYPKQGKLVDALSEVVLNLLSDGKTEHLQTYGYQLDEPVAGGNAILQAY
jgi:hypothetical protein